MTQGSVFWSCGKNFIFKKTDINKIMSSEVIKLSLFDDDDDEFFAVWLTDKRRLALFPAGTIVRDPNHRKSPTHCEQGLKLRRNWVQA